MKLNVKSKRVAVAFLVLQAVLFIGCGLAGLFNPVGVMTSMGIALDNPVSITEIRATYGGFLLGAGCYILYAAFSRLHQALVAVIFLLAGAGVTRFVGVVFDGGQAFMQWLLLIIEWVSVAIAIILYRMIPKESHAI
ncbi:hypothetical protein NBRC116494_33650 [Aurantivibrio plasticivorans]